MEQANYRFLSASDCTCSVQGFRFSVDNVLTYFIVDKNGGAKYCKYNKHLKYFALQKVLVAVSR